MKLVTWLGVLSTILTGSTIQTVRWLTTSQKLSQEVDLAQFNGLVRENNLAKLSLLYQEITVFAPNDEAFSKYYIKWMEEMVLYHLVLKSLSLGDLKQNATSKLQVLIQECPPLWITNTGDGRTFVNDAMIVEDKSNYMAKNRADKQGKSQVLHVIDQVLYPFSELNVSKNTAYDFLQETYKYDLGKRFTVNKFLDKIDSANQAYLFRSNSSFSTFFIPIDQTTNDDEQYLSLDKDLIRAHIVPHEVLFTRPTVKGEVFPSEANDDYLTVLLSLHEDSTRLMIKSRTLYGNSNHPTGEMEAQIMVKNIPVENGVVHLIDKPLGVFRRKLTKFPYLSIATKVTNDLQLNVTYTLAQKTGVLDLLEDNTISYTFFAPTDRAWKEFSEEHSFKLSNIFNQSFLDTARSILLRHLVPGDTLSMDTILVDSVTVPVKLPTMRDKEYLTLSAHKIKDKYYINWIGNGRMTGVARADYDCSNGVVHLIDMPLMLYSETETLYEPRKLGDILLISWRVLKRILL